MENWYRQTPKQRLIPIKENKKENNMAKDPRVITKKPIRSLQLNQISKKNYLLKT